MVRTILVDRKPGEPGFFSVRRQFTIDGVKYRPSICYAMSGGLAAAVRDLAAKGEADLYSEMQVFVTGRPVPLSQMKAKNSYGISPANITWGNSNGQPSPEPSVPKEGEDL